MVWVTHQHSDHLGGARGAFRRVQARLLVDNGTEDDVKQVEVLHDAANFAGAEYRVVEPGHAEVHFNVNLQKRADGWGKLSWHRRFGGVREADGDSGVSCGAHAVGGAAPPFLGCTRRPRARPALSSGIVVHRLRMGRWVTGTPCPPAKRQTQRRVAA